MSLAEQKGRAEAVSEAASFAHRILRQNFGAGGDEQPDALRMLAVVFASAWTEEERGPASL